MEKLYKLLTALGRRGFFNWMSDKLYIEMVYFARFNKKLNLSNPQLFNEKLQWLKLNDRRDIYTTMADKYKAKNYLSKIVDEKYIIKTFGLYNKFEDINFDKLPNKFVIKCTHDSGSVVVVKDKNSFDYENARKIIKKGLKNNGFNYSREWPYKNVQPKVIVEELLENKNNDDMVEYNFFCFNGIPKLVSTCFGNKRIKRYNNYYDIDFNKLYFGCGYKYTNDVEKKPKLYEEMIRISKNVSKGIPILRVDFYLVNGEIKIGELTFYHFAGLCQFKPEKWNKILGEWLSLPLKN